MPIFKSDLPSLNQGANSLAELITGNTAKSMQAQQAKDLALQQAKDMIPVDVTKATQMAPVEASAAGQKQAAQNDANLKTMKDLQGISPDGASQKVGDLGIGVDPTMKYLQQQRGMSDKAIKDATDAYGKGLKPIQDQFNSAAEGMSLINDPKNVGSLGQARTLALKSMGMNRYNEQEAKAVVPPALQGSVANLFNTVGGDETPLNDSQRRSLNTFFNGMADNAHQKHEMLKQNTLGSYQLRNGYDQSKADGLKNGVMANFDNAYADKMKGFQNLPTTTSDPSRRPAPVGTVDKLRAFFSGGQQAAPAQGGGLPSSDAIAAEIARRSASKKQAGQ